jgi:hypothetical protein
MPDVLTLAYEGNYVNKLELFPYGRWDVFSYGTNVYLANFVSGEVKLYM